MFIEIFFIALFIGILLKGSIKNLQNDMLKHIELIFAAYLLETVVVLLIRNGLPISNEAKYALHLVVYFLLFIFVFLNRKLYQILLMGIGFILNALAIFTNGGVMPVSAKAITSARLGITVNDVASQGLYKIAESSTKFYYLCDIIPRPYPRGIIISIGDIFIAIGLFLLILRLMGIKKAVLWER